MSDETPDPTLRSIDLTRIGKGRYKATNARGGVLPIGSGDDPDFSPVELLLAALAGCGAIDVDLVTGKRADAETFDARAVGHKVRDEQGSHLIGLHGQLRRRASPRGRPATGPGRSCRAPCSRSGTGSAPWAARSRSASPWSTSRRPRP